MVWLECSDGFGKLIGCESCLLLDFFHFAIMVESLCSSPPLYTRYDLNHPMLHISYSGVLSASEVVRAFSDGLSNSVVVGESS